MSALPATDASLRRCRGTWSCFVAASFLYLLLPQAALHGTDWRWLVLWTEEPGAVHPQHPGYLALAKLACALLAPLQLPTTTVLTWLSALGGAAAVAGCHRAAWWWRQDQHKAHAAAMLVAVTPAMLHFSTVIEMHAVFAAVMAFALLLGVRWARCGGLRVAAGTGALTGAATLVHATGQLLVPALCLAVVVARRDRGWRRVLGEAAAMAGAHALVWGAGYAALRGIGHLPASVAGFGGAGADPAAASNPVAYLWRWFAGLDLLHTFGPTVWREWLQSYAPFSLLALMAVGVRRLRVAAVLFAVVLLGYLGVTVVLVHAITDERGAYLLPLALPAVLLAQELVPRRAWPVLVLVAIACGGLLRGEPGRLPPDHAFGRAAARYAQQHPVVFFVADYPQMDGAHFADAHLELIVARKELADLAASSPVEPTAEQIAAWLSLKRAEAAAAGRQLVVPSETLRWLGERQPAFAAGWQQFGRAALVVPLDPSTGLDGYLVL
ncbi:MAG: hypothetical protein H6838_12720 [Planctomycetes bacterium]|nr:hypothetical protein [Planctomycetota bacterium]